jgi:hypothetical protein
MLFGLRSCNLPDDFDYKLTFLELSWTFQMDTSDGETHNQHTSSHAQYEWGSGALYQKMREEILSWGCTWCVSNHPEVLLVSSNPQHFVKLHWKTNTTSW